MEPKTLAQKLMETWPARVAKGVWGGVTLPGDVYQGNVSMTGPDGQTSPEVIQRAADLAGLLTFGSGVVPAGANELRAGIRPYQNVPDNLMGSRKNGPQKGFYETNYPHVQDVEVTLPATAMFPRETFRDQIRGMNPDHALERAYRNWVDAIHVTALPK